MCRWRRPALQRAFSLVVEPCRPLSRSVRCGTLRRCVMGLGRPHLPQPPPQRLRFACGQLPRAEQRARLVGFPREPSAPVEVLAVDVPGRYSCEPQALLEAPQHPLRAAHEDGHVAPVAAAASRTRSAVRRPSTLVSTNCTRSDSCREAIATISSANGAAPSAV